MFNIGSYKTIERSPIVPLEVATEPIRAFPPTTNKVVIVCPPVASCSECPQATVCKDQKSTPFMIGVIVGLLVVVLNK